MTTGRCIRRLDRAARHNGLEINLPQVGWVPQERLPTLLGAADVMLLPYIRRPVNLGRSPNNGGHAMAAARPIVTNDTGDLGALVRTEGIGLAAEENGEAMAQAVQTLLDDPARAEAMGRCGRHLAETTLAGSTLAAGLARFCASFTAL